VTGARCSTSPTTSTSATKKPIRNDYDNFYLDWIFWLYLASIELTNRIIDDQGHARRIRDCGTVHVRRGHGCLTILGKYWLGPRGNQNRTVALLLGAGAHVNDATRLVRRRSADWQRAAGRAILAVVALHINRVVP
jgi:hypothetical protein